MGAHTHVANAPAYVASPGCPPLCVMLLTLEPVDDRLVAPLYDDGGLELVRVGALSTKWIAFAHGASAVIVVSNDDPLGALVYAASARISAPIVVAARRAGTNLQQALSAAGAFRFLRLPPSPGSVASLVRALRSGGARHRVDASLRLVLDPVARVVSRGTTMVRLTQREFALLDCLSRRCGSPVAADVLITCAWGDPCDTERARRVLDVHVCHLRRKLESLGLQGVIVTERGFGYALRGSSRERRVTPDDPRR